MSTIPTLKIDSEPSLARHFTPYQIHWILAEDPFHAQGKQVYALSTGIFSAPDFPPPQPNMNSNPPAWSNPRIPG